MIKVLVYGIDVGDVSPISNIHLGNIARRYKSKIRDLGVDVITFNVFGNSDIRFDVGMGITDIFRELPGGWEPDFILIQGPEYLFLPRGLFEVDYPVVFATCDYDYDILRSYHFLKMADCVVCFSDESKEHIQKLGARRVIKFPMWISFEREFKREEIKDLRKRSIDLFYSGNTNLKLMREKSELFSKIAQIVSQRDLKYKISRGYLSGEDYINYLLDSKFSITYHRRKEVQRPEFILAGGVLITNSPEFSAFFKEDKDFFIYRNFEQIGETIDKALDFVNSYNHEERVERILNSQSLFRPAFRFCELVNHIYHNLDLSLVEERSMISKEDLFISDILSTFQLIDIYSLPKYVKDKIFQSLKKIMEADEQYVISFENGFLKEIFDSYKAIIDFNISGKYEFKKSENFILPIDIALLELSRFNYKKAIDLLKVSEEILLKENLDSTFLKYIHLISSVVPPGMFSYSYFPEYRLFFYDFINSDVLDGKSRDFILSYIYMLLGCIFRDISLPAEKDLENSVKMFDKAYSLYKNERYKVEKAKTLIKLRSFDDAYEQFPKDIALEHIETYLPLCIMKKCVNQKIYYMSDIFLSADSRVDFELKEKFLYLFHSSLKSDGNIKNNLKCSFIVDLRNGINAVSIFVQNVLMNIYPLVSFYALSSDQNIKRRVESIFSSSYVKVVSDLNQIDKNSDVFIFASDSLFLDQNKIFLDTYLLNYLGLSAMVSQAKDGAFVISVSKQLFEQLIEGREKNNDRFVFFPISPGYSIFKPSNCVEFRVNEKNELTLKLA